MYAQIPSGYSSSPPPPNTGIYPVEAEVSLGGYSSGGYSTAPVEEEEVVYAEVVSVDNSNNANSSGYGGNVVAGGYTV
jgi:hypothetical protein